MADYNYDVFDRLTDFESDIDKLLRKKTVFYDDKLADVINKYNSVSLVLVKNPKTPEEVLAYLCDIDYKNIKNIPNEYKALVKYRKLLTKASKEAKTKIKELMQRKDHVKAISSIVRAIRIFPKNIALAAMLDKILNKSKLHSELIEIYKMAFYYTLDPSWFVKLGDLYFSIKEYDNAIDTYLNCGEVTVPSKSLYKKLAKAFDKTGDTESKNACLEQIKLLEVK